MAFSNTSYSETVTSLLGDMQKFVKNDYYKFSDKPPTPVEYYHINKDASTIDEGSRLAFADVGKDSPLRFNLVHNFMLYGIETPISVTYQNDEYGLESSSIEGDAYILPNTIRPFPGDIFVISYLKETLLFTVTDSSPDTLETGANMWKITYKSRPTSSAELRQLFYQVVGEYNFIIDNIGTEYNCILKTDVVDFIKLVDEEIRKLKKEIHSMIDTYFSDYKLSKDSRYSDYDVDSAIFDFMEDGEYWSNLNEYVDIYGTSSKFMKDLEKFYKENSVNKVE